MATFTLSSRSTPITRTPDDGAAARSMAVMTPEPKPRSKTEAPGLAHVLGEEKGTKTLEKTWKIHDKINLMIS